MIYLDFTDDQQIRRTVDALEAQRDALANELRIARDGLNTPLPDAHLLEPEDYRLMLKSRQEAIACADQRLKKWGECEVRANAVRTERDAMAKELAQATAARDMAIAELSIWSGKCGRREAERDRLRKALEECVGAMERNAWYPETVTRAKKALENT